MSPDDPDDGSPVITVPDDKLTNGVKFDLSGENRVVQLTSNLTAAQKEAWVAGTLPILGNNNAFAITLNGDEQGAATQTIRVHGHIVTPDFRRVKVLRDRDFPPPPVESTDTAVP